MMSPTGSAISSPPSEPSCYEDRPAEHDDVDLGVPDNVHRLVGAREADHVAIRLVREDDLLLGFRARGVEVAAAVAAFDRLVLNLLGAVQARLHGPVQPPPEPFGPGRILLASAEPSQSPTRRPLLTAC